MMITIEQCRQILGRHAEGMTDEQVLQLHDALYALSNVLIDRFLFEKSESDSERNS